MGNAKSRNFVIALFFDRPHEPKPQTSKDDMPSLAEGGILSCRIDSLSIKCRLVGLSGIVPDGEKLYPRLLRDGVIV